MTHKEAWTSWMFDVWRLHEKSNTCNQGTGEMDVSSIFSSLPPSGFSKWSRRPGSARQVGLHAATKHPPRAGTEVNTRLPDRRPHPQGTEVFLPMRSLLCPVLPLHSALVKARCFLMCVLLYLYVFSACLDVRLLACTGPALLQLDASQHETPQACAFLGS